MIRVSINELEVRYSRAFQGLGMDPGLADDAAWIAAWYDIVGFDGVNKAVAARPRIGIMSSGALDVTASRNSWHIDAEGASLFEVGPVLVDTLEMAVSTGARAVTLSNGTDLELLAGCVDLAHQRGVNATCHTAIADRHLIVRVDRNGLWYITRDRQDRKMPRDGTIRCHVSDVETPLAWRVAETPESIDPYRIAERKRIAVSQGVAVPEEGWRQILDWGRACLVDDTPQFPTPESGLFGS